jgi:hypothetical protein
MFLSETEVAVKKWPYANFAYLGAEHLSFMLQKGDSTKKREYLTVEAVFVPASEKVMFFDHYAKEYKKQRNELDGYLEKLGVDGWKLTVASNMFEGKGYQFRRYHFRRAIK